MVAESQTLLTPPPRGRMGARPAMFQFARVVVVTGLVVWAAVLATPKGRTPLVLKPILKLLRRQEGPSAGARPEPVSAARRLSAFLLVVAAFILAVL